MGVKTFRVDACNKKGNSRTWYFDTYNSAYRKALLLKLRYCKVTISKFDEMNPFADILPSWYEIRNIGI